VAHANGIRIWKSDRDADFSPIPIAVGDELVDLTSDVLPWTDNERKQL
jgi:hypothetical protein